jgi:hypothetical protein
MLFGIVDPIWKGVKKLIGEKLNETAHQAVAAVGGIWKAIKSGVDEQAEASLREFVNDAYLFRNKEDEWKDAHDNTCFGSSILYADLEEAVLNRVVSRIDPKIDPWITLDRTGAVDPNLRGEIVRVISRGRLPSLLKALTGTDLSNSYVLLGVLNEAYQGENRAAVGFPRLVKLGKKSFNQQTRDVVRNWKKKKKYQRGSYDKATLINGSSASFRMKFFPSFPA